jgi:hypothetical protein
MDTWCKVDILGPFMIGVPKKEKKLKDFLELLFTNNIYIKQT